VPSWTHPGSPWRSLWLQCNSRGDVRLNCGKGPLEVYGNIPECRAISIRCSVVSESSVRIVQATTATATTKLQNMIGFGRQVLWTARCSAFSLRGCIDMFALACAPMRRLKSSCSIRSTAACDAPSSWHRPSAPRGHDRCLDQLQNASAGQTSTRGDHVGAGRCQTQAETAMSGNRIFFEFLLRSSKSPTFGRPGWGAGERSTPCSLGCSA
jgi:hypothetical protein